MKSIDDLIEYLKLGANLALDDALTIGKIEGYRDALEKAKELKANIFADKKINDPLETFDDLIAFEEFQFRCAVDCKNQLAAKYLSVSIQAIKELKANMEANPKIPLIPMQYYPQPKVVTMNNTGYDPNNLQQPSLLKVVPSITTDRTECPPPPKGEK